MIVYDTEERKMSEENVKSADGKENSLSGTGNFIHSYIQDDLKGELNKIPVSYTHLDVYKRQE